MVEKSSKNARFAVAETKIVYAMQPLIRDASVDITEYATRWVRDEHYFREYDRKIVNFITHYIVKAKIENARTKIVSTFS